MCKIISKINLVRLKQKFGPTTCIYHKMNFDTIFFFKGFDIFFSYY